MPQARPPAPVPATPPAPSARGGFYLDDGPGDRPVDLETIREPEPRIEPLHRFANNPYSVFGQTYVPEQRLRAGITRGVASWYGRRFHGRLTANGEIYDMYQVSAAHPTLPIPSYARVTNLANGRSVIVRINDRGPFLHGRSIDLSFAAAAKLGYVEQGSAQVEIESLDPSESFASRPPAVAASRPPAARPERPAAMPPVAAAPPARTAALPAPSAATTAAATTTSGFPVVEDRAGIFLQIGAFQSPANAESMLTRLIFQIEELAGRLRVVTRDGLHRIVAGPFRDRVEASLAATRLAAIR